MKFKLTKKELIISSLCLFVIITSPYIGQRINNMMKLGLETILIIVLVNSKFHVKNIINFFPILIYFVTTNISTYLNYGVASSRFANSVVTSGSYVLFYIFFSELIRKHGFDYVLRIIKTNIVVYSIILDFFVIITMGKGLGGSVSEPVYLLGNKFMVSYIHMLLLSLIWFSKKKYKKTKKRFMFVLYFFYSLLVVKIIDTTTGLIGVIVVGLLLLLIEKHDRLEGFLCNPIIIITVFLGFNALLLLTDLVFTNNAIHNFLLSHSHTNSIMSGRYQMYQVVINAIGKNPVWGYGINSEIVLEFFGFGNPQNGLLKSLLDFGIVGSVALIYLIYRSFKNAHMATGINSRKYCTVFLYGMIICSLVEINLATIFFLILSVMNGIGVADRKKGLMK